MNGEAKHQNDTDPDPIVCKVTSDQEKQKNYYGHTHDACNEKNEAGRLENCDADHVATVSKEVSD